MFATVPPCDSGPLADWVEPGLSDHRPVVTELTSPSKVDTDASLLCAVRQRTTPMSNAKGLVLTCLTQGGRI